MKAYSKGYSETEQSTGGRFGIARSTGVLSRFSTRLLQRSLLSFADVLPMSTGANLKKDEGLE